MSTLRKLLLPKLVLPQNAYKFLDVGRRAQLCCCHAPHITTHFIEKCKMTLSSALLISLQMT